MAILSTSEYSKLIMSALHLIICEGGNQLHKSINSYFTLPSFCPLAVKPFTVRHTCYKLTKVTA